MMGISEPWASLLLVALGIGLFAVVVVLIDAALHRTPKGFVNLAIGEPKTDDKPEANKPIDEPVEC